MTLAIAMLLAALLGGAAGAAAQGEAPAVPAPAAPAPPADACLACHLELGDDVQTPPAQRFQDDVHRASGLTCASCHGGDPHTDDPEAAMNPKAGFRGKPDVLAIPAMCGKCHSDENFIRRFAPALPVDQEAKYWTSGHGKALARGTRDVATCASCHGAHGIRKVTDPGSPVYPTHLPHTCDSCHGNKLLMSAHAIKSNPFAEYQQSVHGKALLEKGDIGAPACNDCHGSHGAAPPGVDAVQFVCGTCHINNREQFQKSPHSRVFTGPQAPECITCHGYHLVQAANDAMLGVGEQAVCRKCHSSPAETGYQVAALLGAMVDSLRTGLEGAIAVTDRAEKLGMLVDEPRFQIRAAHEHLVKMRTLSPSSSPDALGEDYRAGSVAARSAAGEAAGRVREFSFRRRGLAVATLLNTALIALVALSIRRRGRRRSPG
jgi:predicted CXXCH cytochrome family protein